MPTQCHWLNLSSTAFFSRQNDTGVAKKRASRYKRCQWSILRAARGFTHSGSKKCTVGALLGNRPHVLYNRAIVFPSVLNGSSTIQVSGRLSLGFIQKEGGQLDVVSETFLVARSQSLCSGGAREGVCCVCPPVMQGAEKILLRLQNFQCVYYRLRHKLVRDSSGTCEGGIVAYSSVCIEREYPKGIYIDTYA